MSTSHLLVPVPAKSLRLQRHPPSQFNRLAVGLVVPHNFRRFLNGGGPCHAMPCHDESDRPDLLTTNATVV